MSRTPSPISSRTPSPESSALFALQALGQRQARPDQNRTGRMSNDRHGHRPSEPLTHGYRTSLGRTISYSRKTSMLARRLCEANAKKTRQSVLVPMKCQSRLTRRKWPGPIPPRNRAVQLQEQVMTGYDVSCSAGRKTILAV